MGRENPIIDKSKQFAYQIIDLYKFLVEQKHEYILSKQIFRSGTSIGANAAEAVHAESDADFYHKFNIALKEANETLYWLDLLQHGKYVDEVRYDKYYKDCDELIRILVAILKNRPK